MSNANKQSSKIRPFDVLTDDSSEVAAVVIGGNLLDDVDATCTRCLQILRVHGLLQIRRQTGISAA
jgi:hypothetical protein